MKRNFFFSGNVAVSEACSAFVEMFLTLRKVFGYFKVNWKSSFSVPGLIIIFMFHIDLCIVSFHFELAEFPVRACVKQKSHTRCARSVLLAPPGSHPQPEKKSSTFYRKKGDYSQTPKYAVSLKKKLHNCCQATRCICGRTDPLIVWSTLSSSTADAWQVRKLHRPWAQWGALYMVLHSFFFPILSDRRFEPGVFFRCANSRRIKL